MRKRAFAVQGFRRSVFPNQWDRGLPAIRKAAAGPEGQGAHAHSPGVGYHQDVVKGMMDASEPFGDVETFIDEAAALDQGEKAALWLLAWSLREGWIQQREALAMLSSLAWRQLPG